MKAQTNGHPAAGDAGNGPGRGRHSDGRPCGPRQPWSFYLDCLNEAVAEGTFVGVFLVRHHATNTDYVPMNNHRQATSESESESHRMTCAVYTKADDIAEGNETRELSLTPTSGVEDLNDPVRRR